MKRKQKAGHIITSTRDILTRKCKQHWRKPIYYKDQKFNLHHTHLPRKLVLPNHQWVHLCCDAWCFSHPALLRLQAAAWWLFHASLALWAAQDTLHPGSDMTCNPSKMLKTAPHTRAELMWDLNCTFKMQAKVKSRHLS